MDTLKKLQELSERIEHLDSTGELIFESLEGKDEVISQCGKMIACLAEDIRFRVLDLVTELERQVLEHRSFLKQH